jgi:ABC-type multidrug transport system fused ATPase/permease subunit
VRQTLSDLFRYLRRYGRAYTIALAMALVASLVTTFTPVVVGRAIDAFTQGTMTMSLGLGVRRRDPGAGRAERVFDDRRAALGVHRVAGRSSSTSAGTCSCTSPASTPTTTTTTASAT